MTYCIHCGQELGARDRFCGRCGAGVTPSDPGAAAPAPLDSPRVVPSGPSAQGPVPQAMVVAERYYLEATLGQGRSGTVYRARDHLTGAVVAVKHLAVDPQPADSLERFQAEAALLRRIDHPDVVRVLDAVVDGAGAWLVTELVTGASLRQVLRSAGRLSPEQALGVLTGCLSGVAAAHEAGVVHGDLKPENILVDAATSTSKLVDFGQARLHGAPEGTAGGSGSGSLTSGTPGYQAPEVLAGAAPGPASDVYALGVVLFECLAGEPPYRAPQAERVALMHAEDPVPPVPGAAPAVSDLVADALAKDPAARPTAGALLARLEQVAEEAYGANWRTRASLGALTAVLGAEGAAIATATPAGAPEAAAARPQTGRGTDPVGEQTAPRRSSARRALQTIAAHKATTAVVAGIVVLGAVGGLFATRASGSSGPAASTRAVAAAQSTTTTAAAAGHRPASASTTAPTTTTTALVAAPTTIAVTTCSTQQGVTSPPASSPPSNATATVTPAQASALSFYADSAGALLVLAPKGWTCSALDSADGGASLAVYPPGSSPPSDAPDTPWNGTTASPADEQAVTASELSSTTQAGAAACSLFRNALPETAGDQTCGMPPTGEQVTPVSSVEMRFTDPPGVAGNGDPSGGSNSATGIMFFDMGMTATAPYHQATCTLSTQYQSLCDPAITDFTTRYSGS